LLDVPAFSSHVQELQKGGGKKREGEKDRESMMASRFGGTLEMEKWYDMESKGPLKDPPAAKKASRGEDRGQQKSPAHGVS